MAWEKRRRGNRRYYYRSRGVEGRVVKEYVGRGQAAEFAAKQDAEARAKREALRSVERQARQQDEDAADQLDGFAKWCELLLAGTLLAAGHHRHRGEWRKRRKRRTK